MPSAHTPSSAESGVLGRWLAGATAHVPHSLPRARLVVQVSLVGVPVALGLAFLHLVVLGYAPAAAVLTGSAALLLIVPLVTRRTGSATVGANLFAAVVFASAFYIGTLRPELPILASAYTAILPVLALHIAGRRSAAWWALLSAAMAVFFFVRGLGPVSPPAYVTGHARLVIAEALGVVGLFMLALQLALAVEKAHRAADVDGQLVSRRVQQARRLESLGTLAAGVAHEINNPLACVLGNSELVEAGLGALVRSEHASALPPRLRATLQQLQAETREAIAAVVRVKEIVADLGTFAQPRALRETDVDLNRVLEAALTLSRHHFKYRAHLVRELGELPPFRGAEGRLCQVFLNLLVNAGQAIEPGAPERHSITVRTWAEDGEVCAEVGDTGSGIAPEALTQLFDAFYTTKPVGVGTGLGLSICHNIVTAYGGRIEVESELGRGSRFVVRLPVPRIATAASQQRAAGLARASEAPRRGRILIVDDEPSVASTLRRVLASEHEVVVARSGAEAEAIVKRDTRFDLIVSDLIMPDVSGMELYGWLRDHHPALAPRVVFLTGGAFTRRAVEFLDQVPNVALEKPIRMDVLRSEVRRLLAPETHDEEGAA